jgi:hypothetical protein
MWWVELLEFNLVVYEILEHTVPGSAVCGTGTIFVVMLCSMPLGWLHDMSKQQLEGWPVSWAWKADGTLDDLRSWRLFPVSLNLYPSPGCVFVDVLNPPLPLRGSSSAAIGIGNATYESGVYAASSLF